MMVQLEMPHINVLSKIDLMEQFGALPFNLEFFTDLQSLDRLLPYLDGAPDAAATDQKEEISGEGGVGSGTSNLPTAAHAEFRARRRRLHAACCELIDDFGLVSFETLNIQDAASVGRVLSKIDKSNGYVFGASESKIDAQAKYASSLFQAISTDTEMFAERTLLVQEKYSIRKDEVDADGCNSGGTSS